MADPGSRAHSRRSAASRKLVIRSCDSSSKFPRAYTLFQIKTSGYRPIWNGSNHAIARVFRTRRRRKICQVIAQRTGRGPRRSPVTSIGNIGQAQYAHVTPLTEQRVYTLFEMETSGLQKFKVCSFAVLCL